jgi:hypothetical protein
MVGMAVLTIVASMANKKMTIMTPVTAKLRFAAEAGGDSRVKLTLGPAVYSQIDRRKTLTP